jgi:hypothetical protein
MSGGKSELASSITIYNELLKRDPTIIETLVSGAAAAGSFQGDGQGWVPLA